MEYFHIFNRGVDKRTIFQDINDRQRFIFTLHISHLSSAPKISDLERVGGRKEFEELSPHHLEKHYGPNLVEILSFVLMSNHYHLLVKVEEPENLAKFAQRFGNSYTAFFNQKYSREGRLFQSKYKSVPVESQEQLIHLSRYIHTNPVNVKGNPLNPTQLQRYLWSSLPIYLKKQPSFVKTDDILSSFKSTQTFWDFTKDGIKNINDYILSEKVLIDYN